MTEGVEVNEQMSVRLSDHEKCVYRAVLARHKRSPDEFQLHEEQLHRESDRRVAGHLKYTGISRARIRRAIDVLLNTEWISMSTEAVLISNESTECIRTARRLLGTAHELLCACVGFLADQRASGGRKKKGKSRVPQLRSAGLSATLTDGKGSGLCEQVYKIT